MEKVFLGIGSNVGERIIYIKKAVNLLSDILTDMEIAPLYISKAVGFEDQPDFINTVVSGYTNLPPDDLLKKIKDIEKKVGRIKRFRWGPREIDIDILFYGNLLVEKNELIIPHPRIQERDFVLKPLSDLDPDFVHPVFKKTVKELLLNLKERSIILSLQLSTL